MIQIDFSQFRKLEVQEKVAAGLFSPEASLLDVLPSCWVLTWSRVPTHPVSLCVQISSSWAFPGVPVAETPCRGPRFDPQSVNWIPHVATKVNDPTCHN